MSEDFEAFVSFIREETNEYNREINKDTLIEDHLGVTGAEANELILAFSKKYRVDIQNFNPDAYFYPEPSLLARYKPIKSLTVGMLFEAVTNRKLE